MAVCVGCGLDINGGSGLLEVQLDPAGGITCGPAGLAASAVPVASIPVSPDACNGITKRGNGLYSPCPKSIVGSIIQTSPQGSGLPQTMIAPGTFNYLNDNTTNSIHICNTTCCEVQGFVEVTVGDTYLDEAEGFFGSSRIQVNIDASGLVDTEPSTERVYQNNGTGTLREDANNMGTALQLNIAVGACHDYQWRLQFTATAGTATLKTLTAGPKFQTRWMLSQTGCC